MLLNIKTTKAITSKTIQSISTLGEISLVLITEKYMCTPVFSKLRSKQLTKSNTTAIDKAIFENLGNTIFFILITPYVFLSQSIK